MKENGLLPSPKWTDCSWSMNNYNSVTKTFNDSIILVENTSVHKLERASAMYKTRNTWTGNRMREIEGMLYSGECLRTFQEILPNIPVNIPKQSRKCRQKFRGMLPKIPGNVTNVWCKWRELLGRVAFRILSNIHSQLP